MIPTSTPSDEPLPDGYTLADLCDHGKAPGEICDDCNEQLGADQAEGSVGK